MSTATVHDSGAILEIVVVVNVRESDLSEQWLDENWQTGGR